MTENRLPLIAILRGITSREIVGIGEALVGAGVEYIEVPLNSPDPFSSIEMLIASCGQHAVCGAGTVLTVEQVERLANSGAKLVVSPHTNEKLIAAAVEKSMLVYPGVATVSEAIRAIDAGAEQLKLFPAGDIGAGYLSSIKEVLPKRVPLYAVGRIGLQELELFWRAGARGFGIGSGLYRPGDKPAEVAHKAEQYVTRVKELWESS